ncbi:MAG: MotA/TolQ/ExbB proton channel family protein [Phycisphaerae bacterium]|nr:MotA/TolQ/ExbB proton channel family protein [Phycisphaerae bacterium]
MDISTIIGFVLGITLVCVAIMINASITSFIDMASIAVVVGGTVAAILISFPLGQVFKIASVVKNAVFAKPLNPVEYVAALVKLAEHARRDGILSLESQLQDNNYDDFLARGLRMAIDGQDPAVIEVAMEKEVETIVERHASGKALLDNVAKYAPAFGMIGTLIGLVIMLQNMDDPGALGPSMAVALITTFYGSLIANLFAMPLADKLALRSEQEIAAKLLIIRGVMSIQAGDNPRIVQQKLNAFLDGRQRAEIEKGSEA